MHETEIGTVIADSASHLHRALLPELPETMYEVTLARHWEKRRVFISTTSRRADRT